MRNGSGLLYWKHKKTLAEAISASEQVYEDVDAFLPFVRQYADLQDLNARILNELIEKIVVHEKERSEDGTVTQQVDIYYKFIGYIDPQQQYPLYSPHLIAKQTNVWSQLHHKKQGSAERVVSLSTLAYPYALKKMSR